MPRRVPSQQTLTQGGRSRQTRLQGVVSRDNLDGYRIASPETLP